MNKRSFNKLICIAITLLLAACSSTTTKNIQELKNPAETISSVCVGDIVIPQSVTHRMSETKDRYDYTNTISESAKNAAKNNANTSLTYAKARFVADMTQALAKYSVLVQKCQNSSPVRHSHALIPSLSYLSSRVIPPLNDKAVTEFHFNVELVSMDTKMTVWRAQMSTYFANGNNDTVSKFTSDIASNLATSRWIRAK